MTRSLLLRRYGGTIWQHAVADLADGRIRKTPLVYGLWLAARNAAVNGWYDLVANEGGDSVSATTNSS